MSKRVFFNSFFNTENKKELLQNKAVILSFIFLLFNSTLSFGNLAIYTPYIYSSLSPLVIDASSTSFATMFDKVLYNNSTLELDASFDGTVPQNTLTFYPVNAFCNTGFATETTLIKNFKHSNLHWSWTLRNTGTQYYTAIQQYFKTNKIITHDKDEASY